MKRRWFVCLLLGLSALGVRAQQNLFNIPSGDITPHRNVFYQHQVNVYANKFESKAHFVYGLGRGWDVGANLVGKGAYFTPEWRLLHNDLRQNGALFPVLLGTLQKQFVLADHTNLNLGTQAGVNLSNRLERKQFNHFSYAMLTQHFGPGRRLIAGGYLSNEMFVGTGNNAGVLLGYEWKLTEKWYLMGDWLSGRNDAGAGVFGLMFWPGKRLQFCAGALLPNPQTPKPPGLVLELNVLGWAAKH
jgi:hypothetical protein